jgi:hypothetical protein
MMKWDETKVYEFLTTDGERHVFVLADSPEQAAEMCGLSLEEQIAYHSPEVIISEKAFAERNCPDDERDVI